MIIREFFIFELSHPPEWWNQSLRGRQLSVFRCRLSEFGLPVICLSV